MGWHQSDGRSKYVKRIKNTHNNTVKMHYSYSTPYSACLLLFAPKKIPTQNTMMITRSVILHNATQIYLTPQEKQCSNNSIVSPTSLSSDPVSCLQILLNLLARKSVLSTPICT